MFWKKLANKSYWQSGTAVLQEEVSRPVPEFTRFVDKRKTPRINSSIPAKYRFLKNRKYVHAAQTNNLSSAGVCLRTNMPVRSGERIELEMKLPNAKKPVRMQGRVAWINAAVGTDVEGVELTEFGVAFEEMAKMDGREKFYHFFADRLCEWVVKDKSELVARPAANIEEMRTAYHLLYREYLKRGYCEESPAQMHYNYFSVLPDTRMFVLMMRGEIVGSVSLFLDSPCGLPMESTFHLEVDRFRKPQVRLAEVGLLALKKDHFNKRSFSPIPRGGSVGRHAFGDRDPSET